jgi:CO/xanthine dehydrogenase FAD-binding subunit
MIHPDITTPSSVDRALSWLAEFGSNGGVVLAGGTDLFVGWRAGIPKPARILNIGHLEDLNGIALRQSTLWIGSLTSMTDMAKSPIVQQEASSLAQAAGSLGSPLIRERATIGGNICHASPAADTAAPLLALDAEIELQSTDGSRRIPLKDFFTGPGETDRKNNELLTGILVPVVKNRRDFYLRLAQRRAMACVKISVAGSAIVENAHLRNVKIALGAVAPIPMLAVKTMAMLEGTKPTTDLITQAAISAMDECNPIEDIRSTIEYRKKMVGELLRQGLDILLKE